MNEREGVIYFLNGRERVGLDGLQLTNQTINDFGSNLIFLKRASMVVQIKD